MRGEDEFFLYSAHAPVGFYVAFLVFWSRLFKCNKYE